MFEVFLGFVALIAGVFFLFRGSGASSSSTSRIGKLLGGGARRTLSGFLVVLGLFLLAQTSYVFIGPDQVGHLNRIYLASELPRGRIIALDGQKGKQASILGPGFHFVPLIRVIYEIEEWDVINVPQGFYGQITAKDGLPLPEGTFIAPAIPDDRVAAMYEDAKTFLTEGGMRGPQESVLKPGSYRINQYLFDVIISDRTDATIIPAGHVGVVKSNVSQPGSSCFEEDVRASDTISGALIVPLVPRGCVGIWKEPLLPGAYYLNHMAYEVTFVDTRVQAWEYKGGFTKRKINLSIDQQGNLRQQEETSQELTPEGAADRAVFVKVEGWDIPLELRALIQVDPDSAPIVVGSVGGLAEVEDRILTPAIRSIVRNVAGSNIRVPVRDADGSIRSPIEYVVRPTRVLDLIENREALEQTIEAAIKLEGAKAGVDVKEIRIGEPAIPPELLLSRQRVQLAGQLSLAYERETQAEQKRIETEQARSTADEQPRLVAAQIAVQVANQREAERAALGRAERQYLEELARGQSAQADVLGKDRVAMLQALEKVLVAFENKPELIGFISRLVPHTVVSGEGGGGIAGAAAILGSAFQRDSSATAASGSTTPQQ